MSKALIYYWLSQRVASDYIGDVFRIGVKTCMGDFDLSYLRVVDLFNVLLGFSSL